MEDYVPLSSCTRQRQRLRIHAVCYDTLVWEGSLQEQLRSKQPPRYLLLGIRNRSLGGSLLKNLSLELVSLLIFGIDAPMLLGSESGASFFSFTGSASKMRCIAWKMSVGSLARPSSEIQV